MSTFSPSLAVIPFLLLLLPLLNLCLISADSALGGKIRLPSERSDGGFCEGKVEPGSCPVKCFRVDPVCGEDGVTYWCGCADALCSGARVSKRGACDVGNGVRLSVPGQALLLIHIVWLILLAFSMLLGLF
ncbi:PREDICTED: uncharacterized protein LOC104825916 [Tarenaya hassleriana]|uniref:uncharacterized protein LOC104825916 n=1 Tax=Tarenaya hassleriana TaxID=28532 RepID=UPI00053C5E06|nr:PREDICTED: uncharacterized protein LOC104825916 [Tarenaya hassleriana]